MKKYSSLFAVGFRVVAAISAAASYISCVDESQGGNERYTLDNVCERMPREICGEREACCEQGPGFDRDGCVSREREICEQNVAEVRAGTMHFNPNRISQCYAMLRPYAEQCFLTLSDLYSFLEEYKVCTGIFTGQRELGAACERSSQCLPSNVENEAIGCDQGKCTPVRFLKEGATCSLGQQESFCSGGLYCNADIATMQIHGVCASAAAVGDQCNDNPLKCGLDSYCDSVTGVCSLPLAGGQPCAQHNQCQSYNCNSETGLCNPIRTLSSELECKGNPTVPLAQD